MDYSVNQAARLVGKSRMTINRAIASGTLSATRSGPGKPWVIDAAELSRVFPAADHVQHNVQHNGQVRAGDDQRDVHDVLNGELRELRARLADSQDQVADLRHRLDTATAQLGEALQQVKALTDQRSVEPAPARRWWQRRRV
jgi:excisionase family DNA binding protein